MIWLKTKHAVCRMISKLYPILYFILFLFLFIFFLSVSIPHNDHSWYKTFVDVNTFHKPLTQTNYRGRCNLTQHKMVTPGSPQHFSTFEQKISKRYLPYGNNVDTDRHAHPYRPVNIHPADCLDSLGSRYIYV